MSINYTFNEWLYRRIELQIDLCRQSKSLRNLIPEFCTILQGYKNLSLPNPKNAKSQRHTCLELTNYGRPIVVDHDSFKIITFYRM